MSTYIINRGDLVYIKPVVFDGINPRLGIIIQCLYGFGHDIGDWLVLVDGKLETFSGYVIQPVE
jgi:hypothetical protein